jgi:hypothetical protein
MKKTILVIMLLCLPVLAFAAYDFETLTIDNTAAGVPFTASKVIKSSAATTSAVKATCTLETAQIRFRIDGTAPTTTVGHPLEIGESFELIGNENIAKFKGIRTGGTSGVLQCSYE